MLNLKKISFILATIIMSAIAGYLVFAWSEPTATPPAGNVPAPINVGTVTQHKAGEIGATLFRDRDNTAWFVDPAGNSVFAGNVGVGTTTPAAPLHVTGNVIAAAPTASNHVATRGWVEAQVSGERFWMTSACQGATTACTGLWPAWPTPSPPACPTGFTDLGVFNMNNLPNSGPIAGGILIATHSMGAQHGGGGINNCSVCFTFNFAGGTLASACASQRQDPGCSTFCKVGCSYRLCRG